MSQSNWDYNKHFQVEFGDFVQASQVNIPKNINRPRKLDEIYLYLVPNLRGGNWIIDLRKVQLITRPKLADVTIIYVVINAVEKIAEKQGFNSLKFYHRKKKEIILPDVNLTGVDRQPYHSQEDNKKRRRGT